MGDAPAILPHPDETLPEDSDERVGVDAVVQSGQQGEDAPFTTSAEPATGKRRVRMAERSIQADQEPPHLACYRLRH